MEIVENWVDEDMYFFYDKKYKKGKCVGFYFD